jgi:RNA polymerase sigma-70 factor (ECF subfamily)
VTALNRAVAVAEGQGLAAGLTALEALTSDPALATYHYLPAARAELLDRLGRRTEAAAAFQEAVTLAANPVEVRHLEKRLRQVQSTLP